MIFGIAFPQMTALNELGDRRLYFSVFVLWYLVVLNAKTCFAVASDFFLSRVDCCVSPYCRPVYPLVYRNRGRFTG
jgi:hypothetical protein